MNPMESFLRDRCFTSWLCKAEGAPTVETLQLLPQSTHQGKTKVTLIKSLITLQQDTLTELVWVISILDYSGHLRQTFMSQTTGMGPLGECPRPSQKTLPHGEGRARAALRSDAISFGLGLHRPCMGDRHRVGVQQPESLESTKHLSIVVSTASSSNQLVGSTLQSSDRPGKGSLTCFILAVITNPIKVGLKSAGGFWLPNPQEMNSSSFLFNPAVMATDSIVTSQRRKLRPLLLFEQRENYLSLFHIKRIVLGLVKNHFGQMDENSIAQACKGHLLNGPKPGCDCQELSQSIGMAMPTQNAPLHINCL